MQEIENIYNFIKQDDEAKAETQVRKIKNEIQVLKFFPNVGSDLGALYDVETSCRKLVIFPYIVIYETKESVVEIARVFDGRQDWQRILFEI